MVVCASSFQAEEKAHSEVRMSHFHPSACPLRFTAFLLHIHTVGAMCIAHEYLESSWEEGNKLLFLFGFSWFRSGFAISTLSVTHVLVPLGDCLLVVFV